MFQLTLIDNMCDREKGNLLNTCDLLMALLSQTQLFEKIALNRC